MSRIGVVAVDGSLNVLRVFIIRKPSSPLAITIASGVLEGARRRSHRSFPCRDACYRMSPTPQEDPA